MKSVTQLKSLGDIRTTISTHARSTPRQQGSTYLEVYLLDKEKQRLETELAMLTKRQKRIERRLDEIGESMKWLMSKRDQEESRVEPSGSPATGARRDRGAVASAAWKKMTVEY